MLLNFTILALLVAVPALFGSSLLKSARHLGHHIIQFKRALSEFEDRLGR
jgi:hypothetical protein